MKTPLLTVALAAMLYLVAAPAVIAGPVERACLRSDRQAATRALCGCSQAAADRVLSGADQRRAAGFFTDPDKAHKVWLSKSERDDAFWDRYKAFGATAEASCGG